MKLRTTRLATLLIGFLTLTGSQSLVAQEPRLRTTLYGHKMPAITGFFSPDGKFLVTKAGETLLWDVATEKSTKVGDGSGDPKLFSPDGSLLLLFSDKSRDFQIYDIARRKNSVLKIKPGETYVAMGPEGRKQLVIINHGLFLRDLATPFDVTTGGNPVAIAGASVPRMGSAFTSIRGAPTYPMQFSADGKTLVVRDNDSNFMLWDVASGKSTTIPKTAGLYFALSPDSKRMVARCGTKAPVYFPKGLDDNIQIFELATGKSIASLQIDKNQGAVVTTMIYSPDSKTIAAASVYQVMLWDATNGRSIAILEKSRNTGNDFLREVHFTPDSKTVIATTGDAFNFWDIASRKITASLPIDGPTGPTLLAFSPDGAMLATGGKDGRISLWDMPGGKPSDMHAQTPKPSGILKHGPSDITWSASDVHAQTPKPSGTLKHGPSDITCLLFSRNGDILVSLCSGQAGQGLKIWDMTTKKSIAGRESWLKINALSPDGKTLAGGQLPRGLGRLLDLWDPVSGVTRTLRDAKYDGALSMAFSPDGKLLAAGGDEETILVWDWAGNKLSAALTGDDARVGALVFSADSKILAAGNYNDKIDLWDLSTGKKTATLKGHADHVSSLSFSPDGKTLASGSDDKTIMLWNIATGKSISVLKGHPATIWYVAISGDGKTLVSGSSDGTIKLWNMSTGQNTATLTGTCGKPALSADGKMLATGITGINRGEIQLWAMPAAADGK